MHVLHMQTNDEADQWSAHSEACDWLSNGKSSTCTQFSAYTWANMAVAGRVRKTLGGENKKDHSVIYQS